MLPLWIELVGVELKLTLAVITFHDFHVHQMDVKTTFLNGILEEEIYMAQHPKNVCKLLLCTSLFERYQIFQSIFIPVWFCQLPL